jgi:hypothetical protein
MEVNIAIIAACGPALKALATKFVPTMFGSSAATRRTGNVYYNPDGYSRTGSVANQGYSRRLSTIPSKGSRPEDEQYGLHTIGKGKHDSDGDSQEAIVQTESLQSKVNDLDFELDDTPAEPRRIYQHRRSG